MNDLRYSLFDFPDNPKDVDWKEEALLFYYYMLNEEDNYERKIKKILQKFKKILENIERTDVVGKRAAFNELKLEIYKIKQSDSNFQRSLIFILLTTKVINKLEQSLDFILNAQSQAEAGLKFLPLVAETFVKQLEDLKEQLDKTFLVAQHELVRITRTESWRFANEERLEEFRRLGYQYKTTYPIKDSVTGDDSWYYYAEAQIKPLNEPFNYNWKGEERVFMTPPDRPNDRNILIPYIPKT